MAKITVYTSFTRPCVYTGLEQLGFPKLGLIHLLPGANIRAKISNWVATAWPNDFNIMRVLREFIREHEKDVSRSYSVSSRIAIEALEGIFEYLETNKETLSHMVQLVDGVKDGLPPRFIPRTEFVEKMSFTERQALLKANNAARLERVEDVE